MNEVTAYYDRAYLERVLEPLQRDAALYRLKARCAARTYFSDLLSTTHRVLEYGCGIGQNIACIPGAVGFDVNPDALRACERRGIEIIARREAIPRGHFDRVLCRHVLEHVEDPLGTLRELLGYLAPQGRLILVLPMESHRRASLEPDVNRHLFSWNFRCINNLVHAAGGIPLVNEFHPMFGPRTYAVLRPLCRWPGFAAYYRAGRLVGSLLNQYELVVRVAAGPSGNQKRKEQAC